MKKKNIIIIVGSLVFLTLIAILLTSYAFISNRVSGNETSTKVLFKRNSIKAEFIGGSEEISNGNEFIAGTILKKEFTLKNTGDEFISYNVLLSDVDNTFNRKDDLVYELYVNNELVSTGIFPNEDTVIKTKETISKNEEKNYLLVIKYLKSFENQSVDNGKIIKAKIDFQETTD